ncbi:MAG: TIGR02391 family protein [Candidatus Aminicenantales bacterium]
MADARLNRFERIARQAYRFTQVEARDLGIQHPFEQRDIHDSLPQIVRTLFDNGHYSQATFEAFKYLDKLIQKIVASTEAGFKLMMQAFGGKSPSVVLNANITTSEQDEQRGFQFVFAGAMLAIRNPRGHEYSISDSPDQCLDHLSLASLLLRRLEQAGYNE